MPLSVGPSPVPRDERRRPPGRYRCRRICGDRYFGEIGVWAMIQIMILGICPDPFFFSLSQINGEAAKSNCVFPEHSKPACIEGQGNCGFTCTDGFTPSYDSNPPACVCAPPSVLCNGVCKESGPCPSANAAPDKKKRWFGSGSCAEKGMGWAACGVYGGSPSAWECVNTARDLESCTCLSNSLLTLRVFVP